jgi:hypothetical protein
LHHLATLSEHDRETAETSAAHRAPAHERPFIVWGDLLTNQV